MHTGSFPQSTTDYVVLHGPHAWAGPLVVVDNTVYWHCDLWFIWLMKSCSLGSSCVMLPQHWGFSSTVHACLTSSCAILNFLGICQAYRLGQVLRACLIFQAAFIKYFGITRPNYSKLCHTKISLTHTWYMPIHLALRAICKENLILLGRVLTSSLTVDRRVLFSTTIFL